MASELHVDAIKHSGGTSAMTIDSSGRVTMPARPAFAVHLETTVALDGSNGWGSTHSSNSLSSGSWDWQTTHGGYNVGSNWASATNRFTAPIAGLYSFTWSMVMAGSGANVSFRLEQSGGTSTFRYAGANFDAQGHMVTSPTHTVQILMAVNDTADLQVGYSRSNSVEGDSGGFGRTWWGGYFIG